MMSPVTGPDKYMGWRIEWKVFGFNAFASVEDGHGAVMANGLIDVAAGTYPVANDIQMNKAGITLQGAGSAQTTVTVSGTGYRFSVSASGVTIKDLAIQKTDKTGEQLSLIHI